MKKLVCIGLLVALFVACSEQPKTKTIYDETHIPSYGGNELSTIYRFDYYGKDFGQQLVLFLENHQDLRVTAIMPGDELVNGWLASFVILSKDTVDKTDTFTNVRNCDDKIIFYGGNKLSKVYCFNYFTEDLANALAVFLKDNKDLQVGGIIPCGEYLVNGFYASFVVFNKRPGSTQQKNKKHIGNSDVLFSIENPFTFHTLITQIVTCKLLIVNGSYMSLKTTLESSDNVKYDLYLKGLSETTVRAISQAQNEPEWMLDLRLKSLEQFKKMPMPTRGPDISHLNFDEFVYYARPGEEGAGYATDWNDVDPEIKQKFQKLGIPEAEQKYLAGAGGQYDSMNVYHKIKQQWADKGIIFEDMPQALHSHPELIKKHFMRLVPMTDHKFAALHGAVWSGGTFIYIPKGVKLEEPLQAYFRMNTYGGGQFEHTLIIIEDDAEGNYIEGCSAPKYEKDSLHAGLVEIYVGKHSKMKYSSVENRSTNTYNLNTKRALLEEHAYMEWVNGNMGSCTTMLYPCSILKGDYSKTDMLGIAVAGKGQNQDTGSKAIHLGKYTSSTIVSKSISKDGGISTYRGLVRIAKSAEHAVNHTECDALLLDAQSISNTIPEIICDAPTGVVAHEASAGQVDESQIFYLTARGIEEEKAIAMIVNGFFSSVVKKLPLEYAGELNKLIELEMEGSVG